MASQEELIVKIGADFDELRKGLKGATSSISKMGDESKKTGKEMALSFAKATIAVDALKVAAKSAGMALKGITVDVVENARQQTLWAQRLQISRESFSSLVAVGNRFGADMDAVGDSIKDLNERIADAASGGKTYEEQLIKMGLRSKDLVNLPVEEQFLRVADAIGKMNNAGAQNFAVADLMGDAGFRMLEVFRLGEDGIRDMRKELEQTNVALSESDFETLGQLGKDFRDASESMTAFSNTIAVLAAGPMHDLMTTTKSWFDALTNGILGTDTAQRLRVYNELLKLSAQNQKEATAETQKNNVVEMEATTIVAEQKLSMLQQFLQEQSELRKSARDAEIQNLYMFNDEIYSAERAQAERMKMLWDQGLKGRMTVAQDFFSSMSVLMQTENKKMFEIGKAAAIAGTVINTIESAQKSFNALAGIPIIGPALGTAAAAAAIAGGMARVQQLSSTTMGGGGGGLAGGGGGAGSTAGGGQPAPVENVIDASFNIEGTNVSKDSIRGVFNDLQEYIDDGARLRSVSVL